MTLAFLSAWPSERLSVLLAQCPDGTPPPCRIAAPAVARRANPPLDDRTWIVLPFENVARAAEIDWLREASVNLLYLDMSKWRDIRVIDDERVADLMREVPETRGGAQITLQTGVAVARRAGAGKLVMGDLLRVGTRTRIVAKVFDVRTGQRVRNVIEETANPDSLMPIFGRLARGILNADPPSEAALGTVGTSRLDAYQEYLAGVQALNAFNTPEARRRFEHALQLDSGFALAHYKLSIVLGWVSPSDRARRAHAEAAARLAGGLPGRERALIAAQAQAAANDYARACETLAPLVRADSNDVEALYNLGECSYHDMGVLPMPSDTSRFMFRSSWNTALRSFRRVLALDPSYHLAFQHIQDAFQATMRPGCPVQTSGRPECLQPTDVFRAALIRAGDTLVTTPVRIVDASAFATQVAEAARVGSRRRNLEEARRASEEWVSAGPGEARARIAYGSALLRLGRVEEAEAALRQTAGGLGRPEIATVTIQRFEALLKLARADDAIHLVDSVIPTLDTAADMRQLALVLSLVLGRTASLDSTIAANVQAPPPVQRYIQAAARTLLGIPVDSLYAFEAALVSFAVPVAGRDRAVSTIAPTLISSFRDRRSDQWPISDTTNADPKVALVSRLALGDTAGFRRALTVFDSTSARRRDEPDAGNSLLSAEAHLALGDTALALAQLRTFRDVTWRNTALTDPLTSGFPAGMVWPRTFLLLGDLAAATGQRAEAAEAYRRFVAMWHAAGPEAQPQVARARAALAQLGN